MVHWIPFILIGTFAYLQTGYWLGVLHWKIWHDGRRNLLFSSLLFPVSTVWTNVIKEEIGGYFPFHVSHYGGNRSAYLGLKAATWPVSLATSISAVLLICVLAVCYFALLWFFRGLTFAVKKICWLFAALWFCMTEGPVALVNKIVARRTPVTMDEPAPPTPAADDASTRDPDAERSTAYRALLAQRAAINADIAHIEREDAATHPEAYREVPQEIRLKG